MTGWRVASSDVYLPPIANLCKSLVRPAHALPYDRPLVQRSTDLLDELGEAATLNSVSALTLRHPRLHQWHGQFVACWASKWQERDAASDHASRPDRNLQGSDSTK